MLRKKRERERDRETERQRDRERDRETERDRERQRERETETERQRDKETERIMNEIKDYLNWIIQTVDIKTEPWRWLVQIVVDAGKNASRWPKILASLPNHLHCLVSKALFLVSIVNSSKEECIKSHLPFKTNKLVNNMHTSSIYEKDQLTKML